METESCDWQNLVTAACRIEEFLSGKLLVLLEGKCWVESISTVNTEKCENYPFPDGNCQLWPKTYIWSLWVVLRSDDYDAASSWIKLSWSCVPSLMSLESTTGTDVMGHEKLISLCQLGRQILIHPKSAYPIYISKGSNPFNFHEIGCLLVGDSDTWNTGVSPIGFWLWEHHTWEISMQIIDCANFL